MRIIGDNSKDVEKQVTCKNCGCLIGYLLIDLKQHVGKDYDGGTDTTLFIHCPKCRTRIIVGGS